ncbi:hypothetical protein SAY86_005682 [Trapa natans]|uniref:Uncharacterized protein n=1 Tax=Trapa natans TaxID=22666 RepID=A0AAN7L3C7_TRANT|nr:hypothetical protein SAY86_005682 [Trapa natans]
MLVTIQAWRSGSNWLDGRRSTKGFPTAPNLGLDHFLSSPQSPNPFISELVHPIERRPAGHAPALAEGSGMEWFVWLLTLCSHLSLAYSCRSSVPVAPSFRYEVVRDQQASRSLAVNLKANGRIRWKIGTWVSGQYRLNVNCVAVIEFGPTIPSGPVSTRRGSKCSTNV